MRKIFFLIISLLMGATIFSQTFFNKSKPLVYTKTNIATIKDKSVKLKIIKLDLKAQKGFNINSEYVHLKKEQRHYF
jgi:hypothetical protein